MLSDLLPFPLSRFCPPTLLLARSRRTYPLVIRWHLLVRFIASYAALSNRRYCQFLMHTAPCALAHQVRYSFRLCEAE